MNNIFDYHRTEEEAYKLIATEGLMDKFVAFVDGWNRYKEKYVLNNTFTIEEIERCD